MADTTGDRPSAFPWPPVLIAAILAISAVLEVLVLLSPLLAKGRITKIAGLSLCLGALVLFWFSLKQLRAHATTVRPDRGAMALVTSGPFGWSRNPIYIADIILLVGLALLAGWATLLLGAACFAVLVDRLAIVPEEAHLERQFGDQFRAYKSKVRRWL